MKKRLFLLICFTYIYSAYSQSFNDGVLEYTIISSTEVSVKKYNNNCPSGVLTIPSTISTGINSRTTYNVVSIADFGFENCTDLTSVIIPNSVINIGNQGFQFCSNLSNITIPDSVSNIGIQAFRECTNLSSITIPNSITNIEVGTFQNCSSLTNIVIPNSVTNISHYAFMGSGLTSIIIPDSIYSIGPSAFKNCTALTSITIPNSVVSIGELAFKNCNNLTEVKVNWTSPLSVPLNIFSGITVNLIPLIVPQGTIALYQTAPVWQDFGSFVLTEDDFLEDNNMVIQLYPNPIFNQLNIKLMNHLTLQQIRLYNINGKLIKQTCEPNVNVNDLQGIFIIQIITDKGQLTKKIIIK